LLKGARTPTTPRIPVLDIVKRGLVSGDGAAYIPVSAEDYEDLLSGKYD